MRTVSVINLKGGVAKTISSINIAHILATVHNYKVLLIDNDKQGNASKILNRHNRERDGIAEVMTDRNIDVESIIQKTDYKNLDIITANMTLLNVNLQVMLDQQRPQQTRIKKALAKIECEYDFCIIDNAPDINISTINALVASDDVLIPIKIDEFAFDGLSELNEQIENVKEDLNPKLNLLGCFVTQYAKNDVNIQGEEWLKEQKYPYFETHIRRTEKVDESTFAKMPIVEYSRRCGAAQDYLNLVEEYINKI